MYSFPELIRTKSFNGLPGLLADCLPEKFGNALLSTYLASRGRSFNDMTAAERLCYLGTRGMGALEFEPDYGGQKLPDAMPIEVSELVDVAQQVLTDRQNASSNIKDDALETLVQIGTSAGGGAKAKAVIAWNEETDEVRSGQGKVPEGFEHWLLKFDAIENEELATARHIGRIEYAYYLLAQAADIFMMESRLLADDDKSHFMTKRFDRADDGEKFHVQTFCGIAHADRDPPGRIGYESLFTTMRQLNLGQNDLDQMFRRMVFNICARNQDDHSRNHAFLMDGSGEWFLSPAYGVCFSYNPGNKFIETHQMSCNGKLHNFFKEDLLAAAVAADVKKPETIIKEVQHAISQWASLAAEAGLEGDESAAIATTFRKF